MARVIERVLVSGDAGEIETVLDLPPVTPRGVAIVAHPHPLLGGTLDNKVVQTLARTMSDLGYVAVRPNFRGVGASAGMHDHGEGETEDLLRLAAWASARHGVSRVVLAGFSFGAYVQTQVARRLSARAAHAHAAQAGAPSVERMVLVGLAAGGASGARRYEPAPVPSDTIVIHGERDETIPLAAVLDWARPQDLPVVVIPGADHLFHRKLIVIRSIVKSAWRS